MKICGPKHIYDICFSRKSIFDGATSFLYKHHDCVILLKDYRVGLLPVGPNVEPLFYFRNRALISAVKCRKVLISSHGQTWLDFLAWTRISGAWPSVRSAGSIRS